MIFDYYFTLVEPPPTDFVAIRERWDRRRRSTTSRTHATGLPELASRGAAHGLAGGGDAYARRREEAHARAVAYGETLAALRSLRRAGLRVGVLSDADRGYLHT